MANLVKAEIAAATKKVNTVKIALVAAVSVVGLMLAAVSVFDGSFLFATAYFIAGVLGGLYAVIKINSTFPPMITCDGEKLVIRMWDNGFFPYNISFRPGFFADFIPARTEITVIPVSEITDMAIGTRGFIAKMFDGNELEEKIAEISAVSNRLETVIKRCDILYIRLENGSVYTVSVTDFDIDGLYNIVDMIEHRTAGLEFKTNLRLLRRKRETIDGRQRI